MATKAEQARVESERALARAHRAAREAEHRRLAARRTRPKSHDSEHAGRKATYALEEHADGARASRKSTRKGANHLRADTNFNLREERGRRAPESEQRHAAARTKQVRGRK